MTALTEMEVLRDRLTAMSLTKPNFIWLRVNDRGEKSKTLLGSFQSNPAAESRKVETLHSKRLIQDKIIPILSADAINS